MGRVPSPSRTPGASHWDCLLHPMGGPCQGSSQLPSICTLAIRRTAAAHDTASPRCGLLCLFIYLFICNSSIEETGQWHALALLAVQALNSLRPLSPFSFLDPCPHFPS